MKKIIFIALTLICFSVSAQNNERTAWISSPVITDTNLYKIIPGRSLGTLEGGNIEIKKAVLPFTGNYNIWINNKSFTDEYHFTLNDVPQTSLKGDTLRIENKDIKYIIIDGQIYEINRSTTVEPSTPFRPIFMPYGKIINMPPDYLMFDNEYFKDLKFKEKWPEAFIPVKN